MEGVLAAGGRQSRLDPIPGHQDGGEHAEEVLAHGVEEAEVLRQQVVDRLKDELQKVGLHGQLLRRCRLAPDGYGMRKLCRESVRVPVTPARFPAREARRWMSALMTLVVASRCCLARMVCSSRSEARSLLESCNVRSVSTPAALILLRTATSVLRLASLDSESCSRLRIWF